MKSLKPIIFLLLILLFPLIIKAQKHGMSVSSDIGLSGQFQIPKPTNLDYHLNVYQRYGIGYKYYLDDWKFGVYAYYMDHRIAGKFEGTEYLNGPIMTFVSIYSSRHLGIAPFVSRTIFNTENFSFSLKLMPGIDNIFLSKQYFEKYPPDDPDDVTVINDWGEDEYGNYDQINFNLTLALEASRSFNENLSLSGGVFLFSYLHNNNRGIETDKIFLPYAFGVNLSLTYYFANNTEN
ncbi:MAG: hypothetical protein ACOCPM_07075 [Bacteroidales bacterium]